MLRPRHDRRREEAERLVRRRVDHLLRGGELAGLPVATERRDLDLFARGTARTEVVPTAHRVDQRLVREERDLLAALHELRRAQVPRTVSRVDEIERCKV